MSPSVVAMAGRSNGLKATTRILSTPQYMSIGRVPGLRARTDTAIKAPTFAPHLTNREIKNPFPGLPALEAAIGRKVTARIGSNECIPADKDHPLTGILPQELMDYIRLYPDPYFRNIRAQLAKYCKAPEEQIIVDAGGDALIFLSLRTRVSPGDVVITTAGTYPTFNYFANGLGANIVEVPFADDGVLISPDLQALSAAAKEHTAAVVYLANPDNPTGHVYSSDSVKQLRESLPSETVLIVDEAYIDFSPENALPSRLPNTIQIRTLSKAYGLAGLRVGYALAEEAWISKADTIRVQFAVNNLTNFLVEKILSDTQFSPKLIAKTVQLREELSQKLRSRGCDVLPSATNFVMIRYKSAEEAMSRQKALFQLGAAVHRPPHPAMGHVIRITAHPQSLDTEVLDILAP